MIYSQCINRCILKLLTLMIYPKENKVELKENSENNVLQKGKNMQRRPVLLKGLKGNTVLGYNSFFHFVL